MQIRDFTNLNPRDENLGTCLSIVGGRWQEPEGGGSYKKIPDPITGKPMFGFYDVPSTESGIYAESLEVCPKSGMHNAFKNPERMLMLAEVSFRAAQALSNTEIVDFFTQLIMRVMPKHYVQAKGEVIVTAEFLKNFSGDRVRFLNQGFVNAGNRTGQQSQEYPWPFGPVMIISPFNFPLEIPALQLMGALYMGNKPLLKCASTVSIVMEQFLHLLHACGLPPEEVDFINCGGRNLEEFIRQNASLIRSLQFTGSSKTAHSLSEIMDGKIKVEDAGFDWKIIGPDFKQEWLDYVAWQCDQDAYAASGQKCSAESILFVHKNWWKSLIPKLKELAAKRKLADLSCGAILSWKTEDMLKHIKALLEIPGAELLFGGKALEGHSIPKCYGSLEPTAIFVPIDRVIDSKYSELVMTEVFGPLQVVTQYQDSSFGQVMDACEMMTEHLTAAVVSNDQIFINDVLGRTVNGTTYFGMLGRTTGAPQNHLFGPAGDPRAAGIGTPEAIIRTWSVPRATIKDTGPLPVGKLETT